jgi:hypothetical protein
MGWNEKLVHDLISAIYLDTKETKDMREITKKREFYAWRILESHLLEVKNRRK